jgi:hypothetical protein
MAFSRYSRTSIIDFGSQFGTSKTIQAIRSAVKNNRISTKEIVLRGAERLDTVAGVVYNDARYWWILAAASDIGWGLQVPAGTLVKIPDLSEVAALIG